LARRSGSTNANPGSAGANACAGGAGAGDAGPVLRDEAGATVATGTTVDGARRTGASEGLQAATINGTRARGIQAMPYCISAARKSASPGDIRIAVTSDSRRGMERIARGPTESRLHDSNHAAMRACACCFVLAACTSHGPPVHTAVLEVTDTSDHAISQLSFSAINAGQAAQATLRVSNRGDGTSGPLALSTTATEFTVSTCAGEALEPGAHCDIVVEYTPAHSGDSSATLTIAADPGGDLAIALTGHALQPLAWSSGELDFGVLETGVAASAALELHNTGTSALPLDGFAVTGEFVIDAMTCGDTLAADARCTVTIAITPAAVTAYSGALTVVSNGAGIEAPLRAQGGMRLTVSSDGNTAGTITSQPAGITCGTECSAVFATSVVLTATASDPEVVVSWSVPTCEAGPTCIVPIADSPSEVIATFFTMAPTSIHVAIDGAETGEVVVTEYLSGFPLGTCTGPCDVAVLPDQHVEVAAITPARYLGLSGSCTTTAARCDFVVPAGTTAPVTAHFAPDPNQAWDALPGGPTVITAAFDSANDLVTGANEVTKVSPTGAVLWTQPIAACVVATGPGDTIYALTTTEVIKLAPDGSTLWSRTLDFAVACGGLGFVHNLAVGPTGEVAIRGATGVARWDAGGTFTWARGLDSSQNFAAVAIDPQGVVMAGVASNDDTGVDIFRFTAAGDPLPTLEGVTSQYSGMFVVNATGAIVATASGFFHTDFYYGSVFASTRIDASTAATGVCAAATGDAGWIYSHDQTGAVDDWTFIRYHADGTTALRIDRAAQDDRRFGTRPYDIAASADGHIALVGNFTGVAYAGAWIEVLAPPRFP
jgi:hypothetical protein